MTESVRAAALLTLCLVIGAGCEGAEGGVALSTVRDSAGITIVENVFPDSAAASWWSVDPVPVLDIGGADVAETHALHQVRDALRLADGRIVVANGSGSDIRIYADDGAHLVTSGRAGEGPGEYRSPMTLSLLPGDSIAVFDLRAGRVSVLDPHGTFVRDFPPPAPDGSRARVVGILDNGTFVGTASAPMGGAEPVEGMNQVDMTVFAWTTPDTTRALTTMPGPQRYINVSESGGRIRGIEIYPPRFAPDAVVAVGSDAIVAGNQDAPQLAVHDDAGTLRRLIRTGAPIRPVTPEHVEAWTERRLERIDPEDRVQVRQREADVPHAPTIPAYDDVRLDPLDHLWVQDYDDRVAPAGTWSVYDAEGRIVARIRLPAGLTIHDIGSDYILGVESDDLDIQHVRMYRLRRG